MSRVRDIAGRLRRPRRRARLWVSARPYHAALGTLAVLLALTIGATLYTAGVARDEARRQNERDAATTVQTIERRLFAYSEALVAVRGLFEIDPQPSRARFAQFVHSLQLEERYPGVRVVSFARAIDATDAPRLTREVRGDASATRAGYPPFTVRPNGRRTRLVVLSYLEPIAGNEPALGFDLLSDPARARAVEITQSTGRPSATAPTRLVQDPSNRPAFVFMLAVRNVGGPLTSARTGRLLGVVTAAFAVDDLLDVILADRARGDDVEVYDVGPTSATTPKRPSRATVIYDRDGELQAPRPDAARAPVAIDVGGRRWLVYAAPRGGTPAAGVPWLVAGGCTLLSLLGS